MERSWVTSPAYRSAIATIVDARVAAGIGQRELARKLGRHASWLNKIERVERRLDIVEFIEIARGLGIPPRELVAQIDAALPTPPEK